MKNNMVILIQEIDHSDKEKSIIGITTSEEKANQMIGEYYGANNIKELRCWTEEDCNMSKTKAGLYKFKHDDYIIAQISYEWSIKAIVMTKDNLVICRIPVEDIFESKAWKKVK